MASSSSTLLSASNSRVELSLSAPHYTPGSTLRPSIHYKEASQYTSTSLRLLGETKATIMGKERWQTGAAVNASLGGGGAGGMPVTSIERLPFLNFEIPLLSSSKNASSDAKRPEKSNGASSSASSALGDQDLYEFVLPSPPENQLLPAVVSRQFDMTTVSVTWTLKFEGIRKGFLKRNDTLSLEIPVVFPLPPQSLPTSIALVHPFKFDTGSSQGMTLQAGLSIVPISYRKPLDLTLTLTPSSSSAAHLLSTSSSALKISASLSRQTRTTPIQNPGSGRAFEWAAVRVVQTILERRKDNDWQWEGTLSPPEGECTVESKGVAVRYAVNCHIVSTVLAHAALHVSLPVFLPTSLVEMEDVAIHDSSAQDLPAYVA
ncbi:hypothetical protein JCM5353_008606 [Sporobolomyces roseus]